MIYSLPWLITAFVLELMEHIILLIRGGFGGGCSPGANPGNIFLGGARGVPGGAN